MSGRWKIPVRQSHLFTFLVGVACGVAATVLFLAGAIALAQRPPSGAPVSAGAQALRLTPEAPQIEAGRDYAQERRECALPLQDALATCMQVNDVMFRRVTGATREPPIEVELGALVGAE